MTIIEGLNALKAQGITRLVGMAEITDIDTYIEHATENHENAVKYAAMGIQTWQYSLDHENDSHMIEIADGHHIISTTYSTAGNHPFDMATYGDYATKDEMNAAFEEYQIQHEAEAIATDMDATRSGELPHTAWVLIAASELRAAYKASHEAFEREYGKPV